MGIYSGMIVVYLRWFFGFLGYCEHVYCPKTRAILPAAYAGVTAIG
jgi:hypothetical protein